MDSPLSDIDGDEIIADSEGEEYRPSAKDKVSSSETGLLPNYDPGHQDQAFPLITEGSKNFFAGFNEAMYRPAPSIADRAKTRQRKRKQSPVENVLELTDDDELMLKSSSSKPKTKRTKEKTSSPTADGTSRPNNLNSDNPTVQQTPVSSGGQLINAKNKVRPRPVKRSLALPHSPQDDRHTQSSLLVPTSPCRPPPNHRIDESLQLGLPPSDPPPTSSLGQDKHANLPPIEVLQPQLDGKDDTPQPSSFPGDNIDELEISHRPPQSNGNYGSTLPQPPPTFFAASSSLPVPAPSTRPVPDQELESTLPSRPDIVDLTDLPPTAMAPVPVIPDSDVNTKAKKAKKPRKKKEAPGGDEPPVAEAPGRKKRPKTKVTVEVPLPQPPPPMLRYDAEHSPPVKEPAKKRKRQFIVDDPAEEDELNLGAGPSEPSGSSSSVRLPPPEPDGQELRDELAFTDFDAFAEATEKPPASRKRKATKRKDAKHLDDIPATTAALEKQKGSHAGDLQANPSEAASLAPSRKRTSKKEKRKSGEDLLAQDDVEATGTARQAKGKRRLVIASDDEESGDVIPPVEDPAAPSPDPASLQNANEHSSAEDATGDTDPPRDDRNVLRPSGARNASPNLDRVVSPQKRYETPSVNIYPSLSSRYTIAPKTQTGGISDLLRRVSSQSNSPFPAASGRGAGSPKTGLTYSPYLKSSRRALSRIAPLHPIRKTPPPPIPPPPPKKKSKKELELEEKWEEEIIEEIGGVSEWLALSEAEKKGLKRMKRDREMGYCED